MSDMTLFKAFEIGKYLLAKVVRVLPRTVVLNLLNKHHNTVLGQIRWFPQWRQYCLKIGLTKEEFVKAYSKAYPYWKTTMNISLELLYDRLVSIGVPMDEWFSASCLNDISGFLDRTNSMHKALKK